MRCEEDTYDAGDAPNERVKALSLCVKDISCT